MVAEIRNTREVAASKSMGRDHRVLLDMYCQRGSPLSPASRTKVVADAGEEGLLVCRFPVDSHREQKSKGCTSGVGARRSEGARLLTESEGERSPSEAGWRFMDGEEH